MKIARNNIAFMHVRSKMIRSRRSKAGNSGALLAYKNNRSSKISAKTLAEKRAAMLQSGGKTSTSKTMLEETKANYTGMKSYAENVQKHLENLLDTEEKSLFAQAKTEGKTDDIVKEITSFVEDYNEMVRKMDKEGGTVNNLYLKQLHGYITSKKSKLENIGIKEDKNGILSIDKKVLKEAELEKLKELFHGEGSFADKVLERSEKIEENAQTNLNSLNSATYSSLLSNYGNSGSRFNFMA